MLDRSKIIIAIYYTQGTTSNIAEIFKMDRSEVVKIKNATGRYRNLILNFKKHLTKKYSMNSHGFNKIVQH